MKKAAKILLPLVLLLLAAAAVLATLPEKTYAADDVAQALTDDPRILSIRQQPIPDGFDQSLLLYTIEYQSGDCEVFGYAAFPSGPIGRDTPSIIYNRGGNRNFGILTPEEVCRFAGHGYITLGSQYRGSVGGTGSDEFGGADVDDVITLVDIALDLPFADRSGVYMVGYSRGGMMTYLACARDERIKAASVGAGMSDCFIMYQTREQGMKDVFHELVGGGPEEQEAGFIARSATYWPEKILPPVLICQGTDDVKVVPEQSVKLSEKLKEAGKEHKLILYEGGTHAIYKTPFVADTLDWFAAHP